MNVDKNESEWWALLRSPKWFELDFTLTAVKAGHVPRFLGPALHGAFGHALKRLSRSLPQDSHLLELCYPEESNTPKGSKSGNYVKPFLFEIHRNAGGELEEGDKLNTRLISHPILASREGDFSNLLFALNDMANTGLGPDQVPFHLGGITPHPAPCFVIAPPSIDVVPAVESGADIVRATGKIPERATIELMTPTQLVAKGRIQTKIDGPVFFRRLWQRVAGWSGYQLPARIKPPFFDDIRVELDETERWDAERFSTRQNKRLDVSGLYGKVTFSRLDKHAWNLLHIGERLHIGKNTTSALGQYKILQTSDGYIKNELTRTPLSD